MRTLLAFVIACGATIGGAAQGPVTDLRVVFTAGGSYVVPIYSAQPAGAAHYVYFDDDPISFEIAFTNWTQSTLTLDTRNSSPEESVSVRLFRLTDGKRDAVPVALRHIGQIVLVDTGGASQITWQGRISLQPRTHVAIPVVLEAGVRLPGNYELRLAGLQVGCDPSCAVRDHGGVVPFELRRGQDLAARLDSLFRQAYEHLKHRRYDEGEELIGRMLRLYPSASAAYQLRAQSAEDRGRWAEAAAAYVHAGQLIEGGADQLRSRRNPHLASELKNLAAAANRQQRRQ